MDEEFDFEIIGEEKNVNYIEKFDQKNDYNGVQNGLPFEYKEFDKEFDKNLQMRIEIEEIKDEIEQMENQIEQIRIEVKLDDIDFEFEKNVIMWFEEVLQKIISFFE